MEERWLPARGWAAFYEVSTLGSVYSLPRPGTPGGLLDPQLNSAGYRQVVLCRYGRVTKVLVSHLVLATFRGPRPPGKRARHGPGGKLDDSLGNLTWG
jgi:NUMOD4 motif-containing protein